MLIDILAAAAEAAPQNQFGFWEAMEQGAPISYIILGTLVVFTFDPCAGVFEDGAMWETCQALGK